MLLAVLAELAELVEVCPTMTKRQESEKGMYKERQRDRLTRLQRDRQTEKKEWDNAIT